MASGLKARTFALLLYLIPTTIAAGTQHPSLDLIPQTLQRRQSTCPVNRPVSCSAVDAKLPKSFCCAAGSTCISLDASSSALCCPSNGACSTIEVISCNVALQDPTNANTGPVVTSRLNDKLPTCGNACCPFGYKCGQRADGSKFCQIDLSRAITSPAAAQSSAASPTPSSMSSQTQTSSTTSPTSTSSSGPTMQAAGAGADSNSPQCSASKSNPFPPGVFLAGFFPGILIGALAVLAWVILTGRHRKPNENRPGSEYGKRPEITDPYADNNQNRPDFVTRTVSLGKSVFAKKDPTGTPGLPFDSADGWRVLTPPTNNNIPAPGAQIPAGPGANLAQTGGYGQFINDVGYPMTPRRISNPTGEILLAYTPQKPAAAVPPLRGMNSQRRSRDSGIGTGYADGARAPYPQGENDDADSIYDSYEQEGSSPSRYEGGGPFQRRPTIMNGGVKKKPDRPETTFTEMLRQINFPDPVTDRAAPAMPAIPQQYRP